MRKVFTLVLVVNGGKVLLGKKGRKHGKGYWNGFGGGVEEGESIEDAAIRECQEEAGITPQHLVKCGEFIFTYPDKPLGVREHEVHVFTAASYAGRIVETEEMRSPTWFAYGDIPYQDMWADDAYWLPEVLRGKRVSGAFEFAVDKSLRKWDIQVID